MTSYIRKKVNCFEELCEYLIRRGIITQPGFPGWIVQAQEELSNLSTSLEALAGGYPFRVLLTTPAKQGTRFVMDGKFLVVTKKGETKEVSVKEALKGGKR